MIDVARQGTFSEQLGMSNRRTEDKRRSERPV